MRDPKAGCVKLDGLASVSRVDMKNAVPLVNQTQGVVGVQGSINASTGAVDRGYIEVSASANPDGQTFNLDVTTFHTRTTDGYTPRTSMNDDKMSLFLQARVADGAREGILNLGVLADNQPLNNTGCYRGLHTFKIAYDDVDAYLAKLNPNLKLTPGAQLAVYARWEGGHEWGGFGRKGAFDVPRLATSTQGAEAVGTASTAKAATLPLDISYKIPETLQQTWASVLEQGGEVTTRLESEMKAEAKEGEVEDAVVELYKLAHDRAKAEQILGAGWKVVPVQRYWRKDDSGNVIESPRFAARKASDATLAGIIIGDPDPLHDAYMGKELLERGWAVRIRSNETKSGLLNVKPGVGRIDPKTLIRQRIEIGMTLAPGANVQDIAMYLQFSDSAFNPVHLELERERNDGGYLDMPAAMQPVLELTAERHRFNLEHKDGVSVEFTADFTKGEEVFDFYRNWDTPRELGTSYICGVEAELDHLNFGQANRGTATAGAATRVTTMSTEQEQEAFAAQLSPTASLFVLPRFHTTEDLNDDAFRTSDSYKAFEEVLAKLKGHLFPQGLTAARQKGQAAAIAMGIICARSDDT